MRVLNRYVPPCLLTHLNPRPARRSQSRDREVSGVGADA